jgi:hypothetical protein
MGDLGKYRLVAIEPMLEEGFQTWPLPTDRETIVGFSANSGMRTLSILFFFSSSLYWSVAGRRTTV